MGADSNDGAGDTQRQRQALATELLDATDEVILTLDTDGRILVANGAFLRRFGLSHEQAVGLPILELISPEVGASRQALLEEAVATRSPVAFEDERDGRMLENRLVPIEEPDGQINRVAIFSRDVTEIRAAKQALLESEARLRTLMESQPVPLWVSRLSDGRILFANESLHVLLGAPPGSLPGQSTPDLYERPEDRTRLLEQLQRHGRVRNMEVPIVLPDAERRMIWLSADVLEIDGEQVMMGGFVDVTERRETEARLRQLQKSEAVGRLAGGIAHDFNNLLTVVEGYASLAQSRLPADHQVGEDIRRIIESTRHAAALTRQLLAYSRKQVLAPQHVDLNSIVLEMQSMLVPLIGESIHFDTKLAEPVDSVWVDPSQLQQILMNLVINARDAMPTGGRLTVATAMVAAGEASVSNASVRQSACVRLTVMDTGTGMDEETRQRVWEPFFTTKPVDKGTGLGLATVLGVVQQSGGDVHVESAPGEGSSFHLYFKSSDAPASVSAPLARGPSPSQEKVPAPPRRSVLLVEDDPMVREVTHMMLGQLGYRVLVAQHGEEAIELARDSADGIDLLLTDLVMPRMSGREVARQLMAKRPELNVLYMSGYADAEMLEAGTPAECLAKPFDLRQLSDALQRALASAG